MIDQKKPHVAHVHNILFAVSPSVYDACFDRHVPVIQTLHNYRFLCPSGILYRNEGPCDRCLKKGFIQSIFYKCYHGSYLFSLICSGILRKIKKNQVLFKKISYFIAPSEFCRRKYVEAGIPEKRIFVKPHFLYDDPGFGKGGKTYALFVGALRDYKGIKTLIDAFMTCRDSYLRIIGDGPIKEEKKSLARGLNNIEFLGHLSHDVTMAEIREALFVIFPSSCYETFGRSIIEAFACGVPVIASDAGAAKELVEPGITGLTFKTNDSFDLAKKIQLLMNNGDLPHKMGNSARKVYENRYTMSRNYEEIMKIYDAAISENGRYHNDI